MYDYKQRPSKKYAENYDRIFRKCENCGSRKDLNEIDGKIICDECFQNMGRMCKK